MWFLYFTPFAVGKPITAPQLNLPSIGQTTTAVFLMPTLPPSQMPPITCTALGRHDTSAVNKLMTTSVVSVATVELSNFGITLDGDFVVPFEDGKLSLRNWHKLKKVGQRYRQRVQWKRELLRTCGVKGEHDQRLLVADPSLPVETIVTVLGLLETTEESPLWLVPSRRSTSNKLYIRERTHTASDSPSLEQHSLVNYLTQTSEQQVMRNKEGKLIEWSGKPLASGWGCAVLSEHDVPWGTAALALVDQRSITGNECLFGRSYAYDDPKVLSKWEVQQSNASVSTEFLRIGPDSRIDIGLLFTLSEYDGGG